MRRLIVRAFQRLRQTQPTRDQADLLSRIKFPCC